MKYILYITIIIGISSCCTKEDCSGSPPPTFIVSSIDNTIPIEIILSDTNYLIIETKKFEDSGYISLNKSNFSKLDEPLKKYIFLIIRKSKTDTIKKINYNYTESIKTCNKCFGFIGGKQMKIAYYTDFTFVINNTKKSGFTYYYE